MRNEAPGIEPVEFARCVENVQNRLAFFADKLRNNIVDSFSEFPFGQPCAGRVARSGVLPRHKRECSVPNVYSTPPPASLPFWPWSNSPMGFIENSCCPRYFLLRTNSILVGILATTCRLRRRHGKRIAPPSWAQSKLQTLDFQTSNRVSRSPCENARNA